MLNGVEAQVKLHHKNIKVTSRVGLVKLRRGFGYFRDVVQDNIFFYNNTVSVVLRALTERLYYVKGVDGFVPCPRPIVPFSSLKWIRDRVRRGLAAVPPVWTYEQFVNSYTGSKYRRYTSAVSNLAARGLRRSDGYLTTFIKAELYNGTTKADPCPRLIQPRSPEFNVELGRYLRPLEKLVYKSIDHLFGHHVVLKCDNMFKRAQTIKQYWGEFKKPVFVGLDASRFDQHVSREALEFEHGLYNEIFRDPFLARLLEMQIDQVGYANMADGSVKYSVEGCRASGDMNTALGNVFLMCVITYNYLHALPCKWRFINDGDDCGIFIEQEDMHLLKGLPLHHLQYGFEMEVEDPVYIIEHVEFCQSRPVQLNEVEWMMVRNIHKAMKHDWICITSRNWSTTEENLVATSACGLALFGDVPVLGPMYQAMSRFPHRQHVVDKLLETKEGWRSLLTGHRANPVDSTIARVSIYKAFDILPDEQVELEREFRAFDPQNIKEKTSLYSQPNIRVQYIIDS